jgi:hypothetical protein
MSTFLVDTTLDDDASVRMDDHKPRSLLDKGRWDEVVDCVAVISNFEGDC